MAATANAASNLVNRELGYKSTNNRRLDQLAWLLEGQSDCVAVSVINGKFCISANEFNDGTGDANQKMRHILAIMNYFKRISNGAAPEESKRNVLIKLICENQISVMGKGDVRIHEDEKWIFEAVISTDVLSKYSFDSLSISDPEKFKALRDHSDTTGLILGRSSKIFRRIRKIESSIEKAIGGNFEGISDSQLTAFRNFQHNADARDNSDILFFQREKKKKERNKEEEEVKEQKVNVHAEMQILGKIITMADSKTIKDKEIYMGISKLCCFRCHHMLDAAINELNELKIVSLGFRGAHDGAFKWQLPSEFGFIGEEDEEEDSVVKRVNHGSLQAQIMNKYEEAINSNLPQKNKYNQRGAPSNSEPSETSEAKFAAYKIKLEADIIVLEERGGDEISSVTNRLKFGLRLCEAAPSFDLLFTNKEILAGIAENTFDSMLTESKVDKQTLFDFLVNPKLTNSEISEYFASLAPNLGVKYTTASSKIVLTG